MPEDLARLKLRAIAETDLPRALALDAEYVGVGPDRFSRWWRHRPDWFRGAYLAADMVGDPGHVVLQSIAVRERHWRRGIGSRLIGDFEARVLGDGMDRISLGSAPDPRTESFYLRNGYRAIRIMLRVDRGTSEAPSAGMKIGPDAVVDDDESRRFYFDVERYDPSRRALLSGAYGARQAIYIFEKVLR